MATTHANQPVSTLVPLRMDRLPWAHFHWMVVLGLGVSWISPHVSEDRPRLETAPVHEMEMR